MSHHPGPGLDAALVADARDGDPRAVEELLSQSLPLIYNIVGRALEGHSDVDDVVQETLLRVVDRLDQLEQPESYRSWMVAITVRRIRDWIRAQQRSRENLRSLPQAEHLPDASDFASLTILRLNLTDQRREVAEATRWLDSDDRELLSLWWLEETGQLERSELADALGLSGRHAAMRVRRLKDQLAVGRGIVRALAAQPACP
ncbi:RNA polymerase sigma factor, partial [Streptomonospora algeriensis]